MIFLETGTIVVFGLLTVSIIALWLPPSLLRAGGVPIWIIPGALSAAAGLYYGIVETVGILYLLILGAFC